MDPITPRHISFALKYPSPNLNASDLSWEDACFCTLFSRPWFADFRAKYGLLILVFQELEMELKTTLDYMKKSYEQNKIPETFHIEPCEASFSELISMFGNQLDCTDGSRDLIRMLHEARKYRNRLAHEFLTAESMEYHMSYGGRKKIIQILDERIRAVIPLVMVVNRVGRAYATDVGMTDNHCDSVGTRRRESLGLTEKQMVDYVFGPKTINRLIHKIRGWF